MRVKKTAIIFDVSDDDDYQNPTSSYRSAKKRGASLPPTGKPPFATTGHKTRVKVEEDSFAWQYNPCRSEYRRGRPSQDTGDSKNMALQGRKLFTTPTSATVNMAFDDSQEDSMPFFNIDLSKQGLKLNEKPINNEEDGDDTWTHLSILPGLTLPKGIKTNFPLLKGMQLDEYKMRIAAFVFHPDKDPREVIFRMGDTVATHDDFACLCPKKKIDPKIMKMLAMKAIRMQHHITTKMIWSLPPSFAEDILLGHTIEDLMTTYSEYWMKPFETLKYIYVPAEDVKGDWYLMVVSVDERVLYHLSCNKDDAIFEERKDAMKNVCNVLVQMVGIEAYQGVSLKRKMDIGSWEIVDTSVLGTFDPSIDSAVYLVDWMSREYAFQPNCMELNREEIVRMKCVMALLYGDHNSCCKMLQTKSKIFWKTIYPPSTEC
ncbi:Papain-like cysteine peptidase superfamily [Sesbania bispinosa]|nr:Papain-like cysteine peptidase superfamily [Sesbania bispinosa]